MLFQDAAQIPVVLVKDSDFTGGCAICNGSLAGRSYMLWILNLAVNTIYVPLHKSCARNNGFGTDPDRVHVGELSAH